ncbi:MAG: class I SAM-dependent methyltransferase, partial [Kordiimonadaceae bacterium]|nr:class I SAM-dependent methyltransferase [Kordiimonadaceae bacterium]
LIKLHGPISVSSYMTEALTNPKYGYYINQNPFGATGDFITAPEVSQMFGELIGLWFADIWLKMGKPSKVHLIEFGPGKGTLMGDFLRVLKVLPDFLDVIELHFVEASPQLIEIQKDKFKKHIGKLNWHETVKSALGAAEDEDAATFIIANEFFDALPIRQFQKGDLGWHERMVTISEDGDGLTPALSPFPVHDVKLPEKLKAAEIHSVIEISPMADYITGLISQHIKNYSGAALFIDYGYTKNRTGETLQAIEKHKYANIFEKPGYADLSAHVNFRKIVDIAKHAGLKTLGPVYQGKFLNDMGIEERVKTLTKEARPQQIKDIISALNRLVAPDEMGTLFKVVGMISNAKIDASGF